MCGKDRKRSVKSEERRERLITWKVRRRFRSGGTSVGATELIEEGLGWRARRSIFRETYSSRSSVKKLSGVVHVSVSLGFRVWIGFY